MSLFAKIFGSSKDGKKGPSPQEAIQKLRETEEMLQKKSDFLEKKCENETNIAKQNAQKNKRIALVALKRRKRYEKQLQQIDGTLSTIEFQREALENASTNTEVLKVMGDAAKALKNTHQMDVDEVHDLMDQISEQNEVANEISEAISNPVGFGQDVDDDDLMAELEEMEQEQLDEKLLEVQGPDIENLPVVPESSVSVNVPSSKNKSEDDEMKELAAWAN